MTQPIVPRDAERQYSRCWGAWIRATGRNGDRAAALAEQAQWQELARLATALAVDARIRAASMDASGGGG